MSNPIKGTSFESRKEKTLMEAALLCIFPTLHRKMMLCYHLVPSYANTESKTK